MGSFDAVCGLSNMALGCGDPVVAMMIRRNPWQSYPNSPIRPYDNWQPASVLVRGSYDDYGNVEIDEAAQAAWALTQKSAMRSWKRVWQEEVKTRTGHVIPANWGHEPITLEESFDNSGEAPDRDEGEFAIWMAHEGVWDHLTSKVKLEWFHHDHGSFTDINVSEAIDRMLEGNRAAMASEYESLDWTKEYTDKIGEDYNRLRRALRVTKNPWRANSESDPVSEFYEEAIWDAFESGDMELYERLTLHWRDSMMLSNILYQLRRTLCPPGTVGPQHGHDQPHLALADAIRAQAALNKTKYEDDDEGDVE